MDFIDINLGPAKKDGPELMPWVVQTVQEVVDDSDLVALLQELRHEHRSDVAGTAGYEYAHLSISIVNGSMQNSVIRTILTYRRIFVSRLACGARKFATRRSPSRASRLTRGLGRQNCASNMVRDCLV